MISQKCSLILPNREHDDKPVGIVLLYFLTSPLPFCVQQKQHPRKWTTHRLVVFIFVFLVPSYNMRWWSAVTSISNRRTVHFCVDCLKKSQFWISQIHSVDKEKHIDSGLWAPYSFNFIYVGRWDVSWSAWTPPCHSSTFLRFLWVFHSDSVQNINFIQLQSHWSKNYSQPDILEVSLHNFEVTFKLLEFGESFQDLLIFHQLW